MVTCCKDCQVRELGCHSKCEIYISAVEKHRAEKEWLRGIRILDDVTGPKKKKRRRKKRG